jgi:hypothetical protein
MFVDDERSRPWHLDSGFNQRDGAMLMTNTLHSFSKLLKIIKLLLPFQPLSSCVQSQARKHRFTPTRIPDSSDWDSGINKNDLQLRGRITPMSFEWRFKLCILLSSQIIRLSILFTAPPHSQSAVCSMKECCPHPCDACGRYTDDITRRTVHAFVVSPRAESTLCGRIVISAWRWLWHFS